MTKDNTREALAEPWRGLHKRLIVLGAAIIAQRTWGERQGLDESGKQDDALAALALDARGIADALAHEVRAALSSQPPAPSWHPIETAPKDGSKILVSWPMRELDEDDAPTGQITSRHTFVTWMNGGCWIEPDYLGASGAWFGDDDSFTADPDLWMPLPSAPSTEGAAG